MEIVASSTDAIRPFTQNAQSVTPTSAAFVTETASKHIINTNKSYLHRGHFICFPNKNVKKNIVFCALGGNQKLIPNTLIPIQIFR